MSKVLRKDLEHTISTQKKNSYIQNVIRFFMAISIWITRFTKTLNFSLTKTYLFSLHSTSFERAWKHKLKKTGSYLIPESI